MNRSYPATDGGLTSEQALALLVKKLKEYGFVTDRELADAIETRVARRSRESRPGAISLSRCIRGMAVEAGRTINHETKEEDVRYLHDTLIRPEMTRALATGSTPGSYLVPTIQAAEIIGLLSDSGALRRLNPRIWPMANIQTLNIPTATATPTVEWLGENTAQSASDPTLVQIPLTLKTVRHTDCYSE